MKCQVSPFERAYLWSVLKGTSTNVGTKTGQQFDIAQAGSNSNYFTTLLLSGICGSLLGCYIALSA